ncbi:probable TraG protein, N-terminal part [Desulfotalea psychrophila LSv54]|uniref:Probable TraG protein, N-terminal part n=1 Tax=Desulfotalea psychrophila (strain LSv54 / DSM 12343) TaxID=177439 RepID=Q6AIG0_DESPS|nr:probable TraG protein, N-terminal part [Desulfotalea psychrophila LSv54]
MKMPQYGLNRKTKSSSYKYIPLIVVCLWFFACSFYCTQQIALLYNYHPYLGGHVYSNLYLPWSCFLWLQDPDLDHNSIIKIIDDGSLYFVFPLILMFSVLLLTGRRGKGRGDLHGTAKWANKKEIKKSGLLGGKGAYVGGWEDRDRSTIYLMHDGPEHILAFAPTRSGKGVGLVLPTLLSWEHSALIFDIKGENYALTSGYRKSLGQKIIRFEPNDTTGSTAKFNPLSEIRINTIHATADAQNIANMICDPEGKGLRDYFDRAAVAFMTGLILHTVATNQDGSLADSVAFITDPRWADDVKDLFSFIIDETDHAKKLLETYPEMAEDTAGKLEKSIKSYAGECLIKASKELSGVISTAISNLSLFRDVIVAGNTSSSDFCFDDIMDGETPSSLYLIIPPSDIDRLQPLIRLFFNMFLRRITERMEFDQGRSIDSHKHRLLIMFDEFTSIGKLEITQKSLAYMAGYGIKFYFIVQDIK